MRFGKTGAARLGIAFAHRMVLPWDSALHALSEQLERFFKDQPELITIAVLMAAHTTLEVLAKHSAADPAEMAQRVEAFIIELHRPQRKVA
jgi:hypothetical protein